MPWQADDGHALREAPMAVIARYWPDGPSLLAGAGAAPWGPINECYDIGRAAEVLGWRPRRNFSEYLADVRSGAASPVPRDGLPPPD